MLSYERLLGKIITLEEALEIFTPDFRYKKQMVFTNGCFDLLHRGHVYYLSKARALGDLLVLGLNSDESVSRLKGPGRPRNKEQARAEVLAALAVVDYIIIFKEDTPLQLIKALKPDLLIKGGDYQEKDIVGYKEVIGTGGKVLTIPLLEGYSTSSIIGGSTEED